MQLDNLDSLDNIMMLFNISDIRKVNKSEVKKMYHRLVKEYHPDNIKINDNTIYRLNEAYKRVLSAIDEIDNINKNSEYAEEIVLSLDDIENIYKNGYIIVGSKKIDKAVLNKGNNINIEFEIEFSTVEHIDKIRYKVKYNIKHDYKIDYKYVSNNENMQIRIRVDNLERNLNLKFNSINIPIKLRNIININLHLQKISNS